MTTQDPELSAALGWPGGISDPVLDRTRLLQMVAALRLASQQALEALDAGVPISPKSILHDWFRAALAQQAEPVQVAERERVASQWDGCVTHQLDTFGPVDIGASIRAGELVEAQQAEPAHDRHGACPTHCCPVHGCKYMHDDCPVAAGAVQPVYPRNNGCESCADDALAQQAEPDHETRAELAEQQVVQLAEERDHYRNLWQKAQQDEPAQDSGFWGRVAARQASRIKQLETTAQQALDSINELFTAEQSEGGERSGHIRTPATREHLVRIAQARKALHESCGALRAAPAQQADPTDPGHDVDVLREHVRHLERRVRQLHAQQAEPVQEPEGLDWRYTARIGYVVKPYTAPPQRTMVPLTEEEIDALPWSGSPRQFARAVEKASWEKNNGKA